MIVWQKFVHEREGKRMCAIAGYVGLPGNPDTRKKMLDTMYRRGPDGKGEYEDNYCTLLHTRLAIIDPERGTQPMKLLWEGKTYVITYNGELYNTNEIRNRLIRCGHTFSTQSDTEVLLHAFAQWKETCLEELNGIFAFGVWIKEENRLFLARDKMGVKPLFYKIHEDGIIFASEIKTILAYPSVRARLDENGVAEILLLGPGRTPGCGVLKGMEELCPGYYAWFERGKLTLKQYWYLRDREHTDNFEDTVDTVRQLVCDAIRRQTVSDVPLGTFLSGGLDSSLISAICARHFQSRGDVLDTFSVDYTENDRYFKPGKFQPNSDGDFIRLMTRREPMNHHWTVLSPATLVNCLEDATRARDLPGMADVDFSLLAFCGKIRDHVKVALSGECADEIFGGYPWYRDPDVRAAEGFPWAQNTAQRASIIHKTYSINAKEYVMDRYKQTISQTDVLPGTSQEERRMKEMVNLNYRWFMQTLLDRKDRMSMYHGLEVRVPFCDYRIAEYLYAVPWGYKDYKNVEKGLLRKAMEGILPDEVLWRKKSPYPKTYHPDYLSAVSKRLKQVLEDPSSPILQIVDSESLYKFINAEYEWPWYGQLMKLPQTIAYMLQINFWMQEYKVELI